MKKNIKARRRGTSVLALGAALSIGAVITPVATAAPATATTQTQVSGDNAPVFAAGGFNLGNLADKFRDALSNTDAQEISSGVDALRSEIEKALNNEALVSQLNQDGQSQSVETLEKFLSELEANKDSLSDIVITLNEVQDAYDQLEGADAGTDTETDTDPDNTDAGENVTGIVDLTMMTKDGKITTTTLEDLPQEALDYLREALEAVMGDAGENADNNTGENTDSTGNLSDSTSVAINITPDGELSITVDTDKTKGDTKTGEEAAKDTASIIEALNKLIEALGGDKPDENDNADDDNTDDTDKPGDTDKPVTDEESQRDRLVSAILALLGSDRGDDTSTDAERDALIVIAKALQDGKDVDLEKLTIEQLITVLDWLNNGIPEPSKSKDKESDKSKEQQIHDLNKAVRDEINALDKQNTQNTKPQDTGNTNTGTDTGNSDSSYTRSTDRVQVEDNTSDSGSDNSGGSGLGSISSLGSGLGSTTSTSTGFDSKSGSKSGTSSNSGSSNSGTSPNSGTNSSDSTDNTTTPTEQPEVEPVSEELAVTGNSTQVMLTSLALLGLIGAGAMTMALRRTRVE